MTIDLLTGKISLANDIKQFSEEQILHAGDQLKKLIDEYSFTRLLTVHDVEEFLKSLKIRTVHIGMLHNSFSTLMIVFRFPRVKYTLRYFTYLYKCKHTVSRIRRMVPISLQIVTNLDEEWI